MTRAATAEEAADRDRDLCKHDSAGRDVLTSLPAIPHATTNERLIVGKIVTDVLAAGAVITVNDGEDDTLSLSADPEAIFAALCSTDEDYLIVTQVTGKVSWARLVWGNDVDVISDCQISLEALLAGANALAEELDR